MQSRHNCTCPFCNGELSPRNVNVCVAKCRHRFHASCLLHHQQQQQMCVEGIDGKDKEEKAEKEEEEKVEEGGDEQRRERAHSNGNGKICCPLCKTAIGHNHASRDRLNSVDSSEEAEWDRCFENALEELGNDKWSEPEKGEKGEKEKKEERSGSGEVIYPAILSPQQHRSIYGRIRPEDGVTVCSNSRFRPRTPPSAKVYPTTKHIPVTSPRPASRKWGNWFGSGGGLLSASSASGMRVLPSQSQAQTQQAPVVALPPLKHPHPHPHPHPCPPTLDDFTD